MASGTFRRRISQIALLSTAFAVLIIVSVASIYLLNKARHDNELVKHTLEVENELSIAQLQIRRAESAQRGYVLTRKNDYLTEYQQAAGLIMPSLQRLADLTRDSSVQQRRIDRLRLLSAERIDEFNSVVDLIRNGRTDDANVIVSTASGGEAMNKIRDVAGEMRLEENRLFVERSDAADFSQSLSTTVTMIGSGLVVLLAIVSIFLVRQSTLERDNAEGKLREINTNLETIIDDRTIDLREANEEIQRFAYIVSHDLRSPLVNIMGFTSELSEMQTAIFGRIASLQAPAGSEPAPDAAATLDSADKQLADDYSEALGFIKSSIEKMDRLINAILNLTREGRRQFQPVLIDTRELIETIVKTVAHQIADANAQVRIEPLPEIVSDRLALEQIFSNLIDNALKYLKQGAPGDILIRGRRKLGFAIFEVIDNGRGIDPKDHQRIFDLFRRAGTQDRHGQGIGLAHVRALVRRMGGTINVSSELNKGSTFIVTLPLKWNTAIQGDAA